MKTYTGSNAGTKIEPVLWNARELIWVISPWIGKDYAKQLASLSHKGIEVRIITSNHDNNLESLQILKASDNPNLMLLVLDSERSEGNFIHSKIYLVDNTYGISGSANLTYSGLHSNVESLTLAETNEEVQQIETDFMRLWLNLERKGMSKEELPSRTSASVRNALPLMEDFGDVNQSNIMNKELVYYPYYFFEFSFRASAGKSPPHLFEDRGFVVLDGATRQIIADRMLYEEVNNRSTTDYVLKTNNNYLLTFKKPTIGDFREARELALDHIQKEHTAHYTQHYRSGSYDRIFVPYRSIIRFIKSDFVQVPIWYIEVRESNGSKHQDIIFGSSGRKWAELVYCADCQRKVFSSEAVYCENCGRRICKNCVKKTGLIFRKPLCTQCYNRI